MSPTAKTGEPTSRRPLRLWPGVVAAVLMSFIRFVLPVVAPEAEFFGMGTEILAVIGGLAGALAILAWWLFFSRARWSERLGAIAVMAVAILAILPLTHVSIQGGMMGRMFFVYAVPPTLGLAFVAWAVATRRLSEGARRATMVVAILIGCGVWTLARTNGILRGVADFEWRWTPTAEERLLAQAGDEPAPPPASSPAPTPAPTPGAAKTPEKDAAETGEKPLAAPAAPTARAEWPGFRGPERDGVVRGVHVNTDWSASPPVEMWRRQIGPGWSSFAVSGGFIYTQEQRGNDEIVSCYRLSSGEPVWRHRDAVRFYESNGGAGPRGTPTVVKGRVYTLGATGLVNALDARSGSVLWSRNAATDTNVELPGWGITSSPLVVGDLVIVAVSGRLVAYDTATGDQRWLGPAGGSGYSSPHLFTIDGVDQILLLRGSRTISVAPADGALLWEHTWLLGVGIVQPALAADGDVLISVGDAMGGLGMRRLAVARGPAGWAVKERWTTRGLKPYFNDFVVHDGHAFGFDGNILACINLEDGERKWKGGRYGNGQMVLLRDQDVLLVISEEGELALVSATTDKFTEIARFPALDGKTWNHPVVVGDVLLVRNGEEMAAFRLPVAGS